MNHVVEKGITASAKSIDSCQPARIAQADMGRYYFALIVLFSLAEKDFIKEMTQSAVRIKKEGFTDQHSIDDLHVTMKLETCI